MLRARAVIWILFSALLVCVAMAAALVGDSGTASEKATEITSVDWTPPKHYRFVSISERLFQRYPPEEAKRLICIVERVTGIDPDQNPLVTLYVEKDAENTRFYISEIIVPGVGEKRLFLSLRNRVAVISNDSLDALGEHCRGGE